MLAFNDDGSIARLGAKAFGLAWGSVGCILVSFILFIVIYHNIRKEVKRGKNELIYKPYGERESGYSTNKNNISDSPTGGN